MNKEQWTEAISKLTVYEPEANCAFMQEVNGEHKAFEGEGPYVKLSDITALMETSEQNHAKADDIMANVWEFLGGLDAEMTDDEGRVYLWPTLGPIYKSDFARCLEEVIVVQRCTEAGCHKPSTWCHGTWYWCEEHARLNLTGEEFDAGEGMSDFGTARRTGYLRASNIYVGPVPDGLPSVTCEEFAKSLDEQGK